MLLRLYFFLNFKFANIYYFWKYFFIYNFIIYKISKFIVYNKNIPKILIENKCDQLGDESHYNDDFDSLKKFSNVHKFSGCFRTSALNGYNVDEAINFLIDEIIKSFDGEDVQYYNSKIIKMNNSDYSNNEKNRCC